MNEDLQRPVQLLNHTNHDFFFFFFFFFFFYGEFRGIQRAPHIENGS